MKKILIAFVVLSSIAMSSCKKYLDKKPYDYQVIENYYQTPKDIEYAVTGCYNALISINRTSELLFNENRSDNGTYAHTDNITSNTEAYYPSILMVDKTNDYVNDFWAATYDLIARTNLVIENINVVTDSVLKAQYKGQTEFLRAWAYFKLVRSFGAVPLVTKPVTTEEAKAMARTPVADVYNQIILDLKDSYTQINSTTGKYTPQYGQVTKWAAHALLGKVYLAMGDNTNALAPLENVYLNSGFTLTANYADLFVVANETVQANKEVLFPVRFTDGGLGLGNNFSTIAGATQTTKFGTNLTYWSNGLRTAFTQVAATDTLVDTRYKITCANIAGNNTPSGAVMKRYIPKLVGLVTDGAGGYKADQLLIANDGPLDWPELRFADVVLMYAEIKGQTDGLAVLNRIRTRAKVPVLTAALITSRFGGDFKAAVLNERRLELAFENDRWFDLRRLGNAYMNAALLVKYNTDPAYATYYTQTKALVNQITLNGTAIDPYRFLLPIPANQVLLSSGIVQNPGY